MFSTFVFADVASGITIDYYFDVEKVLHLYTIQLQDRGTFILPPTEIAPTAEETWDGIRAMVKAF